MSKAQRHWLVRTKTKNILGPFTQAELFEQLKRHHFQGDDEIASVARPGRAWISAQTLLNRDVEEVTCTSTPLQTRTVRMNETEHTPTPTPSTTITPMEMIRENDFSPSVEERAVEKLAIEELTREKLQWPAPQLRKSIPKTTKALSPALVLSVVFVLALATFIYQMSQKQKETVSLSAISSQLRNPSEAPFLREVYELIGRDETSAALAQLTRYHQTSPKDFDYLIPYAALLIHENKNHAQARLHLDKILTESVSSALKAKAHLWYGYSLLASDEEDLGESHFLEALQLSPNDPAARFNLGRTYIKLQKYEHAIDYLQLAEVEVPDLWLIHIYKGRAKDALGKLDEARASFRSAIEYSPDRWLSYIYYAVFLLNVNDTNEARLTLQKMLTRDPSFEHFSPSPWGFYQEELDYQEYLEAFQKVMMKNREEYDIGKVYISFLLNGKGPVENQVLQRMAEKGSPLARVLALNTLIKMEPKEEELRRALVRLSGNLSEFGPYAYVIRAEAKTRLGNLVEAQQDLKLALLTEPKSAAAHFLQYKLYRIQNKKSEATQELQTILSYHPNYIPAIRAASE